MLYRKLMFPEAMYLSSLFCILATSIPTQLVAEPKSKTHKCTISVRSLKNTTSPQAPLFVDVRDKRFFNKKYISGSINVPLTLIHTKTFLKNKNVILIGNGWNEPSLTEKCGQLKDQGFTSVKVLAGGIFSWFKHQKKTSKRTLISLTAHEFFSLKMEKKFVPVVILDKALSPSTRKEVTTMLAHAKLYSLKTTKRQLLKGLHRLGKGGNHIVIFSDTNPIVDAALNDYLNKPLRKVYYFEGGFNAYKQVYELNKLTAVSNQHKRLSTKKPVSCAN